MVFTDSLENSTIVRKVFHFVLFTIPLTLLRFILELYQILRTFIYLLLCYKNFAIHIHFKLSYINKKNISHRSDFFGIRYSDIILII